jgi:hypothetical protein
LKQKSSEKYSGLIRPKGAWRIRYNEKTDKLYDDVALSTFLCLKRLQWAGHTVRVDDPRTARKATEGGFGGRRTVGMPGGRQKNAVWRDAVDLLHIRYWKAAASKTEAWKETISETIHRKRAEDPYKKKKI